MEFYLPHNGPRTQVFGNIQPDGHPHAGDDFGYTGADGQVHPEVYAAAPGVVLYAGDSRALGWPNPYFLNPDFDRTDARDDSAGNAVIIRHDDGGMTTYNHLESWSVRRGQRVTGRQRIATTGSTGRSTGKHLHFEWIPYPCNFNTPTYGRVRPTFKPRGIFMYLTQKQELEVLTAARAINLRAKYLDAPVSAVPRKSAAEYLDTAIPRKGGRTGNTTPRNTIAYQDANLDAVKAAAAARDQAVAE